METKKTIGFIVAIEIDAVFALYENVKELPAPKGFKLYEIERKNDRLFVLQAGMGECAAAAGVQYLISVCKAEIIVNFGVVGGLTADMRKQKVVLVNRVVHYKYDCSEFMDLAIGQVDGHNSIFLPTDANLIKAAQTVDPEIPLVTCASGDKFISTKEEKEYLHNTFEGDICDMESAGIVLTCEANDVPCIMFKAVSDGLADGAAGFYAELSEASVNCLKTVDCILSKYTLIEK